MKNTFFCAFAALCALAAGAAERLNTVLVVPDRQLMIQLAFDMRELRGAEVVSWSPGDAPDKPNLFLWTGAKWNTLTLDDFRSGARFPSRPGKTIFLGLDTPAILQESVVSPARYETFDPAMLINELNAFYRFSEEEWRLLARRYKFMLHDANERLRRQNRYAQPPPQEQEARRRAPVLFNNNPPPARITEPEAAAPARSRRTIVATPAVPAPAAIVPEETGKDAPDAEAVPKK